MNLRVQNPGLIKHTISTASSSKQWGKLLDRIWKHWGPPPRTASWSVFAVNWISGHSAQVLHIMWFLQPLPLHREEIFWAWSESTEGILMCESCQASWRTLRPDPQNYKMSTACSSPQEEELLNRVFVSIETSRQSDSALISPPI